MKRNHSFAAVCVLLTVLTVGGYGQTTRASGSIKGRVVADDGRPVGHAVINVVGVGGHGSGLNRGRSQIVSDDEGNFVADRLDPMPYQLSASAPGYVQLPAPDESDETHFNYIGDSITITMQKGAIITGKVTNGEGNPVIGVQVRAIRIRDEQGRPAQPTNDFVNRPRTTDDRGIYRLYGLAPGVYVLSAGGGGFSIRVNPYDGRMPIYYPSSTRDAASEITARSGDELSGMDIRYRAERGVAVSGRVLGAPAGGGRGLSVSTIMLRQASTGAVVASTFIPPIGDQNGWGLYGVADGEYELVASNGEARDEGAAASPLRRITVAGRDLTGIDLMLAPLALVDGKVAIEKLPGDKASSLKCERPRQAWIDEIVVFLSRDEANSTAGGNSGTDGQSAGTPDSTGNFRIRNLRPGRFRMDAQLPDEFWYLKSVTQAAASATTDVGRAGMSIAGGEKKSGVVVTIAEGAAAVKGNVVAAKGEKLPSTLRVFLVPAEKERADDVAHYEETNADSDGSFAFSHLAPGKYLLVARAGGESDATQRRKRPVTWDSAERAKLRKEAEATNVAVEPGPCQRVGDVKIEYKVR